jgi:hypothetical protein
VRHVRILRVCLAGVFALSSIMLSLASPALAKKRPEGPFERMNECPLHAVVPVGTEEKPIRYCSSGEAGPESFFQAGKVTIHFVKPILLRGGIAVGTVNGEEYDQWIGARNGDTISKEAEPAPGLTEVINPENLAEPEKGRYEKYIASGKSTKTTETIELAAPASDIFINTSKFFGESGESYGFPVMIHIENKFLGKNCYDGNTVEPITVPFTTGLTSPPGPNTPISGEVGNLLEERGPNGGEILGAQAVLVNNEYAAPAVSGCGISGGADAALDAGLGLPSPAGSNTTKLIGDVWLATAAQTEEEVHL